jgi:hypothetical protein
MQFPFVSRERLNDKQRELDALRDELATVRQQHADLWNFVVWRTGGGVAFDTSRLPAAYQPQASMPVTAEKADGTQAAPPSKMPGAVRRQIATFEQGQQTEADKLEGKMPPPPRRVSKEQLHVVSELHDAANEGLKAAGQ